MKTLFYRFPLAIVASMALLCSGLAQSHPPKTDDPEVALSNETRQELARVRQATLQYHNLARAENDEYVDVNLFVSGQGFHFVNFGLVNGTFDPEKPQILRKANGASWADSVARSALSLNPCLRSLVTTPSTSKNLGESWRKCKPGEPVTGACQRPTPITHRAALLRLAGPPYRIPR